VAYRIRSQFRDPVYEDERWYLALSYPLITVRSDPLRVLKDLTVFEAPDVRSLIQAIEINDARLTLTTPSLQWCTFKLLPVIYRTRLEL